jgi:hypothetical protein
VGQWLGQVMWPGFTYSMPIPELVGPENYDHKRFLSQGYNQLCWSLWPRRCAVSNKWLWLTQAHRTMYIITGPGDPAIWVRWYSRQEMLLLKLKGY